MKPDIRQLSSEDIRAMIARGERTAEGWRELQERSARWQAAKRVIDRIKAVP